MSPGETALSKITVQGYIVVPREDLAAVVSELPRHIELTKQEEGCLFFEVTQDPGNDCIFMVREKFSSRSAFEFHQERVEGSLWGSITASVERHYEVRESG
ncbi:MAG: antibiotic biosynthesis monooxygenase [Halioglobus sp.]|nr:antibiotic biosynthesis monooxygenase [Halioglobus sp.]